MDVDEPLRITEIFANCKSLLELIDKPYSNYTRILRTMEKRDYNRQRSNLANISRRIRLGSSSNSALFVTESSRGSFQRRNFRWLTIRLSGFYAVLEVENHRERETFPRCRGHPMKCDECSDQHSDCGLWKEFRSFVSKTCQVHRCLRAALWEIK